MILKIFSKKLKIVHVVSEVSPYSKVGGLGDVGYALPKAIARLGHEVVIVSPYYSRVRKLGLKKETIDPGLSLTIDGVSYPLSFRKLISPDGIPIYFVVNEEFFGSHQQIYHAIEDEALRWIFFAQAVFVLLKTIEFQPDIIHAHDWTSGLVPNYLRTAYRNDEFFSRTASIYTIHNLQHQGTLHLREIMPSRADKGTGIPPEQKNFRPYINFVKRGIVFAHAISTVSERYAKEILTREYGVGVEDYLRRRRERIFGIINGIDYEVVNPAFDKNVFDNYDFNSLGKKLRNKTSLQKSVGLTVRETIPLLGVVNRLSEQKGFNLIMSILPQLLKMNLQIVVVGSGDKDYLKFFREAARKHRSRIAVCSPFTEKMGSRVYAGSDIYLMPSRYEPCGLSQLVSLRYGSIPLVRSVGGLHDTVTDFDPRTDTGNGFVFDKYDPAELLVAISRAIESYKHQDAWRKLVFRAMKQSFSWELPAKKYADLYRIALKLKQKENNNGT